MQASFRAVLTCPVRAPLQTGAGFIGALWCSPGTQLASNSAKQQL